MNSLIAVVDLLLPMPSPLPCCLIAFSPTLPEEWIQMPIVNVTRVASFLNLRESRIAQLVKESMLKEAHEHYDPVHRVIRLRPSLSVPIPSTQLKCTTNMISDRNAQNHCFNPINMTLL
jgi:hypothetical protein